MPHATPITLTQEQRNQIEMELSTLVLETARMEREYQNGRLGFDTMRKCAISLRQAQFLAICDIAEGKAF